MAAAKKQKRNAEILFWICFAVYTAAGFYLFLRQAAATGDGRYLSDMPLYIGGVLGTNNRDPYPYRLFFWAVSAFHTLLPVAPAAAAATSLFNTLTVLILRRYIRKYLSPESRCGGDALQSGAPYRETQNTLLLFCCLFASMLILPFPGLYKFPGQYYIGQGTGNMWHNATYLATRPFATLAFFLFGELLQTYERKPDLKKTALFSAALFLTTFTKPTFTAVLLPAAGILLLVRLILRRGKTFKNTLFLGLSFLPAAADLLRQYIPVFGGESEAGIGFGFGDIWREYTASIPFSIFLCFAFPLAVLLFNLSRLKQFPLLGYTWVLTLTALFEGIFLFEDGDRKWDGNFLQGYQHMMFYLFIFSAIIWFSEKRGAKKRTVYNIAAGTLFCGQVVSGIFYFIRLLLGYKFY